MAAQVQSSTYRISRMSPARSPHTMRTPSMTRRASATVCSSSATKRSVSLSASISASSLAVGSHAPGRLGPPCCPPRARLTLMRSSLAWALSTCLTQSLAASKNSLALISGLLSWPSASGSSPISPSILWLWSRPHGCGCRRVAWHRAKVCAPFRRTPSLADSPPCRGLSNPLYKGGLTGLRVCQTLGFDRVSCRLSDPRV